MTASIDTGYNLLHQELTALGLDDEVPGLREEKANVLRAFARLSSAFTPDWRDEEIAKLKAHICRFVAERSPLTYEECRARLTPSAPHRTTLRSFAVIAGAAPGHKIDTHLAEKREAPLKALREAYQERLAEHAEATGAHKHLSAAYDRLRHKTAPHAEALHAAADRAQALTEEHAAATKLLKNTLSEAPSLQRQEKLAGAMRAVDEIIPHLKGAKNAHLALHEKMNPLLAEEANLKAASLSSLEIKCQTAERLTAAAEQLETAAARVGRGFKHGYLVGAVAGSYLFDTLIAPRLPK